MEQGFYTNTWPKQEQTHLHLSLAAIVPSAVGAFLLWQHSSWARHACYGTLTLGDTASHQMFNIGKACWYSQADLDSLEQKDHLTPLRIYIPRALSVSCILSRINNYTIFRALKKHHWKARLGTIGVTDTNYHHPEVRQDASPNEIFFTDPNTLKITSQKSLWLFVQKQLTLPQKFYWQLLITLCHSKHTQNHNISCVHLKQ